MPAVGHRSAAPEAAPCAPLLPSSGVPLAGLCVVLVSVMGERPLDGQGTASVGKEDDILEEKKQKEKSWPTDKWVAFVSVKAK